MSIATEFANFVPMAGIRALVATTIPCLGACAAMTMLQIRMRTRRRLLEERLAKSLSMALRHQEVNFNVAPPGTRASIFRREPEEPDAAALQVIPSRYDVLGYPRSSTVPAIRQETRSRVLCVQKAEVRTWTPDQRLVPGGYYAPFRLTSGGEQGAAWVIPPAITRPLVVRRSFRRDVRWGKRPIAALVDFSVPPSMALLKVGPLPLQSEVCAAVRPCMVQ